MILCIAFAWVKTIDLSDIVHVLKAVIILTSVHLNLSNPFVVSHVKSAKAFPWTEVKLVWGPRKVFLSLEQSCPFSRGNRYKDYVITIFPGPNFVSSEWRCPLNRGVPKDRFHHIRKIVINKGGQAELALRVTYWLKLSGFDKYFFIILKLNIIYTPVCDGFRSAPGPSTAFWTLTASTTSTIIVFIIFHSYRISHRVFDGLTLNTRRWRPQDQDQTIVTS